MFQTTLAEIVARLGGELHGDPSLAIGRIAPLEDAAADAVAFLANPRYRAQLQGTGAACVIVAPALADEAKARGAAIVTPDPYLYFARLTQWWAAQQRQPAPAGVHASAVVEAGAQLGEGVSIGPLAFVASGAVLGAGVVVGSHCHIGAGVQIG